MKTTWLHREENPHCVLFFNGWGMDEKAVQHLDYEGVDVCMCYDYTVLEPLGIDFSEYKKITLVAWSLGVWACSQVLKNEQLNIEKTIAINGTLLPVDTDYGIPPSIFTNTQVHWNAPNRDRFSRRVLGGKAAFELTGHRMSRRSVEDQQGELGSILNQVVKNTAPDFCFDKVLIGQQDMIFSPNNQWEFWKRKAIITEVPMPHYPFSYFKNWQQITSL